MFLALAAAGFYFATTFDSTADVVSLSAAESPGDQSVASAAAQSSSQETQIDAGIRRPDGAEASISGSEETSRSARQGSVEVRPVYFTVHVAEGDTVGKLANVFGVDADSIIVNNPGIEDPDFLAAGQEITIPGASGIIHAVRYGESIEDIARTYGTTEEAIRQYSGNAAAFDSRGRLRQGVAILAVGGEVREEAEDEESDPSATPEPTSEPTAEETAEPTAEPTEESTAEPTEEPAPEPSTEPITGPTSEPEPEPSEEPSPDPKPGGDPTPTGNFTWPVQACGPFSEGQLFHNSERPGHGGLDIPLFCSPAAPIRASDGGTVTLADWNGGYGIMVVIDHGNGFETWYAHLGQATVTPGEQVAQGELVGYSGCTGSCYGEHLHFEVHHNGVAVDPLDYLP